MPYIVVGIDGSETAQTALRAAVGQAQLAQAEVRVLNVIALPTTSFYEFGPIDLTAVKASASSLVSTAIEQLTTSYGGELPVLVTGSIVTGHAGLEILRAAKDGDGATMVIVGSRGMGGFKSLLLGSVTTYLAHHLSCPLLIIPGGDR